MYSVVCVCQTHVPIIHGALDFNVKEPLPSPVDMDLTIQGPPLPCIPTGIGTTPAPFWNVFLLTMPVKPEELDWNGRFPKIHLRV